MKTDLRNLPLEREKMRGEKGPAQRPQVRDARRGELLAARRDELARRRRRLNAHARRAHLHGARVAPLPEDGPRRL
jgi:hypothetical protein